MNLHKFAVIFFLSSVYIHAQNVCPCAFTDNIFSLESDNLVSQYQNRLEDCYNWRESAGIMQNYCNHSILIYLMHIDPYSMSYNLKKLYTYLAEKCLDYHKKLDYPVNLCDTANDSSQSLISIEGRSMCQEMKDDLDEDSAIYLAKWSNQGANYELPDYLLTKPTGGRKFYTISAISAGLCVLGTIGTFYVASDFMAIPRAFASCSPNNGTIAGELALLGLLVDILIPAVAIECGVLAGVMGRIGLKKDKRIAVFDEQSKFIQHNPNIGFEVKLYY